MTERRGVRFGPGSMVPAGEYRNVDTGGVRWFDGSTPLPGSVNSASWEQVSDHYHYNAERAQHPAHGHQGSGPGHHVRFAAATMVPAGEYRNCETGVVRYFDGATPLPGSANSASWEQVHDHYMPHPEHAAHTSKDRDSS